MALLQGILVGFGFLMIVASSVECTAFNVVLAARNLPNMDVFNGAPDPYVKLFLAEGSSDLYKLVGTTGVVKNQNNPNWTNSFNFKFVLGGNQRLRFEVWDQDVDSDDSMGRADLSFARIANTKNSTMEVTIMSCTKPVCGKLLVERVMLP